MSTNMYIELSTGESTANLHLCKMVGDRISTFAGDVFPTLAQWRQFVDWNASRIRLMDEYGLEYDAAEFFNDLGTGTLERDEAQLEYVRSADDGLTLGLVEGPLKPNPDDRSGWWLDEGFLFTNAVFC